MCISPLSSKVVKINQIIMASEISINRQPLGFSLTSDSFVTANQRLEIHAKLWRTI